MSDLIQQSMSQTVRGLDYPIGFPAPMSGYPLRCLTGDVDEMPWKETYVRNSNQIGATVAMNLDHHSGWWNDEADPEYVGRLSWRRHFSEGNIPPLVLPSEFSLEQDDDGYRSVTSIIEGPTSNYATGNEVHSYKKLEQSGTYRIQGKFKEIESVVKSNSSLRWERFYVYVMQYSDGYYEGSTRIPFGWIWETVNKSPPNSNGEILEPFPPYDAIPEEKVLDYTFEMDSDFPYSVLMVMQETWGDAVNQYSRSKFSGFNVKRIA